MEIVGRHHDPFTVMEQFARPIARRRLLAAGHRHRRRAARARRRARSPRTTGWSFSAFRCRPRPPTCWRAIWRCRRPAPPSRRWPSRSPRSTSRTPPITRTSRRRSGCRCTCSRCGAVSTTPRRRRSAFLAPRRVAVTLSNFYGGLIAAVITPVAVAAYWLVTRPDDAATRCAGWRSPSASSGCIAAAGLAYACVCRRRRRREPRGVRVPARRSVPLQREVVELSGAAGRASAARRAGAAHLGRARASARGCSNSRSASAGASSRSALVADRPLAGAAIGNRQPRRRARAGPRRRRRRRARLLAVAGADDRRVHLRRGPSALLYDVVPMFRSYARFGVVVQLMAALLAGIGVDCLRRAGTRRAQVAVRRARGARRRRIRGRAVGAVARRAADDGAPLGRCSRPIACGSSTARRSLRSPHRFSG